MMSEICPECGHEMTRDIRPLTITYKGLTTTFDMPGWYCVSCGEGVHTGKDMEASDRGLHYLKAQVEGLLLPEDIRRIRKKLHLSQAEAGALLGGGPNAFHKYESGLTLPSQAISNLLRLLSADPRGLDVLRNRHSVGPVGAAADTRQLARRQPVVERDTQVAVAAG
jgi:HTH-type transcriptional regulator/antitoxin MqsA